MKTSSICLLFVLSFGLTHGSLRDIHETLDPENGLERGDWGPVALCPLGTIVTSFEFKYASLGNVDDTAGNGIKLYCENSAGGITYVTSSEGLYGTWQGIRKCPGVNDTISGVALQVLPPQGNFGDDLGVTNVEMLCRPTDYMLYGTFQADPTVHRTHRMLKDGRSVETMKAQVNYPQGDTPTYGSLLICSPGYSMCGLQTRVEPDHVIDDDAGLVDAIFFCC